MNFDQIRSDLECITQQRAVDHGESLREVLSRLDTASEEPGIPERLEHYLNKRSYVKALEWLDNPDLPHKT